MRKNVSTSPAQRAGPLWYTATTDNDQKRRSGYSMPMPVQVINDVDALPPGRRFVGQGNRLQSCQSSVLPLALGGSVVAFSDSYLPQLRRLHQDGGTGRNVFLAPGNRQLVKIHCQSPQILNMQSSYRGFPDRLQKWTFYADSSLDESTTDSDEKLILGAAMSPAGKPMQSNVQPLIMVEPLVKQHSPMNDRNRPGKRTPEPKPKPKPKLKPMPNPKPKSKPKPKPESESKPITASSSKAEAETQPSDETSLDEAASALSEPQGSLRHDSSRSTAPESEGETRSKNTNPINPSKYNCGDSDDKCPECQLDRQPLDEVAKLTPKQQREQEEEEEEAEQNGDVVGACEVTETQFISFNNMHVHAPAHLEEEAGQLPSCWNAVQQFYLPAFMGPEQLAQAQPKSFGCQHCQTADRMSGNCCKCRVHQPQQQPGPYTATPCSCCSMCLQQRQPPLRCHAGGLTEQLAQQLQQKMDQAQAQIDQIQMHLNSVLAGSQRQTPADVGSPAGCRMPNCKDRAEVRCCAQCPMATAGAGLYALGDELHGSPPHGLYCEPAPQQQQQQMQTQQPQQLLGHPIQLAVNGRGRQHCCRQRYAKMRFMLPRCWPGSH